MVRGLSRVVPWIGLLLIAGVAVLAASDIVRTYHAAVDDSGRELETQARIIAEQTTRTMQAVDVVLRHIAAEYHSGRLARLNPDELSAYLHDQAVGLTQIDGFALLDAQGDVRATSWKQPNVAVNLATLPGFVQARDDPRSRRCLWR